MSRSHLVIWVLLGLMWSSITLARAQRDQVGIVAGTGTISGFVEVAGTSERLRGAVVTLSSVGRQVNLDALTDGEGRFVFEGVPAGSYGLSARRPSFVSIPYGASRAGRTGLPIVVSDGQTVSGLRVQLARGSVITGVVSDELGAPIPDMEVRVERQTGGTRLQAVFVRTNYRGEYRAYGLPAGSYVVSAWLLSSPKGEFEEPSTAEVDAALRRLELGRGGISTTNTLPSARGPSAISRARKGSGVPVYHPSAFNRADANLIDLGTGEERRGADISFRLMSASSLTGRVSGLGGYRNVDVELALRPVWAQGSQDVMRTSLSPDGAFSFVGVVPGRYTLGARVASSTPSADASSGRPGAELRGCLNASENILVQGGEVHDVVLPLRPCPTLAGYIRTNSETAPTSSVLSAIRVDLRTAGTVPMFQPVRPPTAVGADGRFVLGEAGELIAGEFYLAVTASTEPGRGWHIESASTERGDILDDGLTLGARDSFPRSLTLVFTEQHNSLSGTLAVDSIQAPTQFTVVVVPANPAWWKAPFRRLFAVRPNPDGRFRVDDLPAGDYYVAAMTDLAPDEWRDLAVLKEIAASGIRISIGPTEHKVQSLRIGR